MSCNAVLSCLSLLLAVAATQVPKPCVSPPLMTGGVTVEVYYEIDWSNMSCKKKPLDTAFVPMRVPFDAQLIGRVVLGSSSSWGMGVLVNNWYGDLPNNGHYTSVFTEVGCIPLTFTSYTPTSGWGVISTFNWVLGTTNPMDVVPPFFCAKAKLEMTETPDNTFTALASLALKTKRGD